MRKSAHRDLETRSPGDIKDFKITLHSNSIPRGPESIMSTVNLCTRTVMQTWGQTRDPDCCLWTHSLGRASFLLHLPLSRPLEGSENQCRCFIPVQCQAYGNQSTFGVIDNGYQGCSMFGNFGLSRCTIGPTIKRETLVEDPSRCYLSPSQEELGLTGLSLMNNLWRPNDKWEMVRGPCLRN